MASVKQTFTLDEALLARLMDFADSHGMTRSGLVALAVEKYMDAEEMIPDAKSILKNFATLINSITNGSEDDAREQIERIDKTYEKIMGLPSKKA